MSGFGEALLERELELETIDGIEHYRPGQRSIEVDVDADGDVVATLGFVNPLGRAVRLQLARLEGRWLVTAAADAGVYTMGRIRRAPEIALSEETIGALEAEVLRHDEASR